MKLAICSGFAHLFLLSGFDAITPYASSVSTSPGATELILILLGLSSSNKLFTMLLTAALLKAYTPI